MVSGSGADGGALVRWGALSGRWGLLTPPPHSTRRTAPPRGCVSALTLYNAPSLTHPRGRIVGAENRRVFEVQGVARAGAATLWPMAGKTGPCR